MLYHSPGQAQRHPGQPYCLYPADGM